jgi:predicted porin
MKIAIAALPASLAFACALPAFGQSSVTVFGVLDAGIGRISSTGTGSVTGVITGGNTTSRLGFRGSEDLGGGLSASFWLEGELQVDTGNLGGFSFQRRSTVSLSGNFGEVRLGRDFVTSYVNMYTFEPYLQRALGTIELYGPVAAALSSGGAAFNYVRNSNSVTYYLPGGLGGFYGAAQYAFGERSRDTPTSATNSKKQGDYAGARVGYGAGPLNVSGSYGVFSDVSRAVTYVGDYKMANVGVSYDFGVIQPMLLVQSEWMKGRGTLADFRFNTYAFSFSMPVGLGVVRGGVSRYDNRTSTAASADATKFGLGYVYNLSKRTALYADVARVKNGSGASFIIGGIGGSLSGATAPTAGGNSTGYAAGLKHSF